MTVIIDRLVLALTLFVVRLAHVIGARTGYYGSWDFGVGLTRLRGSISNLMHDAFTATPQGVFTGEDYLQVTRASSAELEETPHLILGRLLGRLLRALGTSKYAEVRAYTEGPTAPEAS